jgi:DNA-binding transcriptional LysR family regulator
MLLKRINCRIADNFSGEQVRKFPTLKGLRAFEAAARLGSILQAADELRVTASAVSHQIRLLEEEIGVRLFHRAHRRSGHGAMTAHAGLARDHIDNSFSRISGVKPSMATRPTSITHKRRSGRLTCRGTWFERRRE